MRRILAATVLVATLAGCGLRVEMRLESCADRGGRVVQTGTQQVETNVIGLDGQIHTTLVDVPTYECVLPPTDRRVP